MCVLLGSSRHLDVLIYSHTRALRNPIIKKLYHGILDFGLRNYGAPTWGSSSERFHHPRPTDGHTTPWTRLAVRRARSSALRPITPLPSPQRSDHPLPPMLPPYHSHPPPPHPPPPRSARARRGFARGQAQKALRNYGEAAAAASETLKKLRQALTVLFS